MRQKSLNVLEFDKIKALVEKETMSDLGKEKVVGMVPATDIETVEFQINETDEIAQIYNKYRLPNLSGLSAVSALIHRATIGGVLSVKELNAIKRLIQIQNQYKTFYNNLLEEEEEVNYIKIFTKNVMQMIYLTMQVMNYKVFAVKYLEQRNV